MLLCLYALRLIKLEHCQMRMCMAEICKTNIGIRHLYIRTSIEFTISKRTSKLFYGSSFSHQLFRNECVSSYTYTSSKADRQASKHYTGNLLGKKKRNLCEWIQKKISLSVLVQNILVCMRQY